MTAQEEQPLLTAALPQCLCKVTVGNSGCQPCWILQHKDALETAASLSKALTTRSVVPAKAKMICKPPWQQGHCIPGTPAGTAAAGSEGQGLGEGPWPGCESHWTRGAWGGQLGSVPILFVLHTAHSLEIVWISKEENEPNPSTCSHLSLLPCHPYE